MAYSVAKVRGNLSKLIKNSKRYRVWKKFILPLINGSNYNPDITKCRRPPSKDAESKV